MESLECLSSHPRTLTATHRPHPTDKFNPCKSLNATAKLERVCPHNMFVHRLISAWLVAEDGDITSQMFVRYFSSRTGSMHGAEDKLKSELAREQAQNEHSRQLLKASNEELKREETRSAALRLEVQSSAATAKALEAQLATCAMLQKRFDELKGYQQEYMSPEKQEPPPESMKSTQVNQTDAINDLGQWTDKLAQLDAGKDLVEVSEQPASEQLSPTLAVPEMSAEQRNAELEEWCQRLEQIRTTPALQDDTESQVPDVEPRALFDSLDVDNNGRVTFRTMNMCLF